MKLILILFFISFASEIKALSKTIYKSTPDQIECSDNQMIFIEDAEWTNDMAHHPRKKIKMCNFDSTASIKEICNGQNHCQIDETLELLYKECDNWTELNVTYHCEDHSQYLDQNKTSSLLPYQEYDELTEPDRTIRNKRAAKCPNRVFERKHICRNCRFNNLNDVVNFARAVEGIREENNWANTNLNSVFTGSPSYTQRGTRCVFTRPIRKYNCYRRGGNWSCFLDANRYATHDLNSGHYDHRQDV